MPEQQTAACRAAACKMFQGIDLAHKGGFDGVIFVCEEKLDDFDAFLPRSLCPNLRLTGQDLLSPLALRTIYVFRRRRSAAFLFEGSSWHALQPAVNLLPVNATIRFSGCSFRFFTHADASRGIADWSISLSRPAASPSDCGRISSAPWRFNRARALEKCRAVSSCRRCRSARLPSA